MPLVITRPGVVTPVRIDPEGLTGPTAGQARGPRWRSVPPGWFVPAHVDGAVLDQRIAEAVAACGLSGTATGWAALAWQGARWFDGLAADGRTPLPVPVALRDQRMVRTRRGVEVSEDWLFGDDVVVVDGLPITVPERSVSYEARRARTLTRAVQVIDMTAADDLVDIASMTAYCERLIARPGIKRLRAAIELADENVWSVQEVPMRLRWREDRPQARLLCNAPLFGLDGHHLLTPDLFDPDAGVAGEYEGAVHLQGGVRRRDLDREALGDDLGLEVVTMMSADGRDLTAFRSRLDRAYRRAVRRPRAARSWTLEQPDWWVDTSTVARRRALDERGRAVWLRHRAS